MRNYIVVSHAYMAQGIVSSLKMIMGEQTAVDYICGYVDGNEDLDSAIQAKLAAIPADHEILIFTDLFGGSANNAVLRVTARREHVHVIAGVNLALLLSMMLAPDDQNIEEMIRENIKAAKEGIVYCGDLKEDDGEWEDF